ncbi:MAG TPA: RNA polymerase sigma factor [Planctomycetota bacterium]|nr:RNA polymerase sigma factor [Planctomycetota bacterium]
MSGFDPRANADDLLGDSTWMRALARSLIRDESTADDIIQDAWVARLERSPRQIRSERSWLSRVVRNRASRVRRNALRVRRREGMAARREAVDLTPDAIVERAELHRAVVDAVLDLAEPYRSTLLLRYFEDLTPEEIAARDRAPVATVRTRIHRALERLRVSLDGRVGARSAWIAALAPIAALDSAHAVVEGGVAASGVAASSAAGAASSLSLFSTGSFLLMQKPIVAAACAALATLALGVGIGRLSTGESAADALASGRIVERRSLDDALEELTSARAEMERLRSQGLVLERERDEIAKRAESLASSLETLRSKIEADEAVAAAEASAELPIAFGELANLEGIRNADWSAMAEAADTMNELWLEFIAARERGEPIPADFAKRMQAENAKLVTFVGGIIGKVPTHSPVNGEFTHPLVTTNLMAAVLERAGHPLTAEQRQEIASLGREYEEAFAELGASYGDDTPELRKLIDELELKQATMRATRELLHDAQREAVVIPELADRMQVDVLSPLTMAIMLAKPMPGSSANSVRSGFTKRILEGYGIDDSRRAEVAPAIERFFEDVAPLLAEPVDPEVPLHLDQVLVAGRAHAALLESVLALPELSAEARSRIISNPGWPVPLVTKKKGE